MTDHERHGESTGAYVLGALPELERQAFERHLLGCAACRDEVEALRFSVDALPRSVEQFAPPPTLRRALLREVEAEARVRAATQGRPSTTRRRRSLLERVGLGGGSGLRPALAGALAGVVLLAGGGLAGYRLGAEDQPAGARTLAASVDRARLPQASGSLVVPAAGAGAMPVLRVQGVAPPRGGRVLQLWLRSGGQIVPAGVFTVRADGTGEAVVSKPLDGVDAVMVTRERAGGAPAPTEVPVLVVRID